MSAAKGTSGYLAARREFESRWNEFSIQQRILCPSERISNLMELVRAVARNETDPPEALLNLAGQTIEKATRMVGAHCNYLFQFCARRKEAEIIQAWLESDQAKLLSEAVRTKLAALL
jgi:hypothetical protein